MPPEYLAIGALFSTLSVIVTAVIQYLRAENKELKQKLDESNKASRDLIALQAQMLRAQGVQIVPVPPEGRP